MTTSQLDDIALGVFEQYGAQSAPKLVYGIPATILISVNDEIVHGTPGTYEIKPGDLVKIDVTAELDGYMADAAITVPVFPISSSAIQTRAKRSAWSLQTWMGMGISTLFPP